VRLAGVRFRRRQLSNPQGHDFRLTETPRGIVLKGAPQTGAVDEQLANTAKARQYDGLKYADDRHDAFWIAQQMRLGILPTGYIYPKEQRAVQDLLRVRRRLVRERTTHVLSTQSAFWRHTASKPPYAVIMGEKKTPWPHLPNTHDELGMETHRAAIETLNIQIERIERTVLRALKPRKVYQMLLTVDGIGPVIAWTILLESGDLSRFKNVGQFICALRR
jgi:transposase